jgi:hypothetical protein
MSKLAFLTMVTLVAAILSPSVVVNSFAKSSDGDSGSSETKKPKHDAGPIVAGVPAPQAAKHKQKAPIVAGVPAPVAADHGGSSGGYNDNNLKTFYTSKSPLRIAGSNDKMVTFKPGFNETFFNSTLPYCFAVKTGACYDSTTGQVVPP